MSSKDVKLSPIECSNCAFFLANTCRSRPPVVVGNGQWGITTQWPAVKKDDWCGEHRFEIFEDE